MSRRRAECASLLNVFRQSLEGVLPPPCGPRARNDERSPAISSTGDDPSARRSNLGPCSRPGCTSACAPPGSPCDHLDQRQLLLLCAWGKVQASTSTPARTRSRKTGSVLEAGRRGNNLCAALVRLRTAQCANDMVLLQEKIGGQRPNLFGSLHSTQGWDHTTLLLLCGKRSAMVGGAVTDLLGPVQGCETSPTLAFPEKNALSSAPSSALKEVM